MYVIVSSNGQPQFRWPLRHYAIIEPQANHSMTVINFDSETILFSLITETFWLFWRWKPKKKKRKVIDCYYVYHKVICIATWCVLTHFNDIKNTNSYAHIACKILEGGVLGNFLIWSTQWMWKKHAEVGDF